MAKKQVIWSRSAKKDLYAALESHLKKYDDKKLTALFFTAVERKIQLLRKSRLLTRNTSMKNIHSFSEGNCHILFEEQEHLILVLGISEIESWQE